MPFACQAADRECVPRWRVARYLKNTFVGLEKPELPRLEPDRLGVRSQGIETIGQMGVDVFELREISLESRPVVPELVAGNNSGSPEDKDDQTVGGEAEINREKETRASAHI